MKRLLYLLKIAIDQGTQTAMLSNVPSSVSRRVSEMWPSGTRRILATVWILLQTNCKILTLFMILPLTHSLGLPDQNCPYAASRGVNSNAVERSPNLFPIGCILPTRNHADRSSHTRHTSQSSHQKLCMRPQGQDRQAGRANGICKELMK